MLQSVSADLYFLQNAIRLVSKFDKQDKLSVDSP